MMHDGFAQYRQSHIGCCNKRGFFEGNGLFLGRAVSVPTTTLAATTIIDFAGVKG